MESAMKGMRNGLLFSLPIWGAILLFVLQSGCGGIEFKSGIYRVDTHQASERSESFAAKPVKCWFMPCKNEEVGS